MGFCKLIVIEGIEEMLNWFNFVQGHIAKS